MALGKQRGSEVACAWVEPRACSLRVSWVRGLKTGRFGCCLFTLAGLQVESCLLLTLGMAGGAKLSLFTVTLRGWDGGKPPPLGRGGLGESNGEG